MPDLLARLASALQDAATVTVEADGALTVATAGSVASVRVVPLADDLEIVSLNQPLAWDLPGDDATREVVLRHAAATMLGTVTLVDRDDNVADVMLRYNFPGTGLSDDALRTLVLMVLATGADIRAELLS
ncbi:hypothetical protein [Mycolicibacterium brumae]|uniref:YbjN domain-containing protein n=1 Tax=Mycolicibacterium brumae TaxID=85968 RepID=A0A2G5P7Q1_9MYCO|nr:hypothetical protein [Mycolicibacterium brumae]MCV7194749.1 hypothetical protein [Mycolicibacterium brumae]PIB74296.1 hypothetical protein CQY22_013595 [Mycolicibacterium brumae]RWA15149.1 hypothetical protein MBRU_11050 [Mycolicibacterium brumae DSM 44177]UWW08217.1 hypothetical protein L2Z93_001263 [Mycolicibacterium brumae]